MTIDVAAAENIQTLFPPASPSCTSGNSPSPEWSYNRSSRSLRSASPTRAQLRFSYLAASTLSLIPSSDWRRARNCCHLPENARWHSRMSIVDFQGGRFNGRSRDRWYQFETVNGDEFRLKLFVSHWINEMKDDIKVCSFICCYVPSRNRWHKRTIEAETVNELPNSCNSFFFFFFHPKNYYNLSQ